MAQNGLRNNGDFSFTADSEVKILEKDGNMTREPWLMLLTRRGQKQTETLCWGLTNCGTAFARIGTQEGDLVNGFVHEDPYKTKLVGPYAYIVDENGKYFSNTWYPVLHKDQTLDTRFGFGYVQYNTSYNELAVTTTCFIPNQFDGMIQIIRIKNNSSKAKKLKMFNVNPINIGDARSIQFTGFNHLMGGGGIIDKDINAVVWRNGGGIPFKDDEEVLKGVFGKVAIHTSSFDKSDFSTKYEEFVGHYTNNFANPAALSQDSLSNKNAQENTSSLSTILNHFTLNPGEEKDIVVALIAGSTQDYYTNNKKEIKEILKTIKNPAACWKLFDEVKKSWIEHLDKLKTSVPNEEIMGHSVKWLQYQCFMVAMLNRMKSRFHSGFEYGYGFRDILQDLLALLPYDPKQSKDFIMFTAKQMFSDGSVYHNFFVSAKGNKEFVACDDPLWLIYAVCEYIKETGDFSILEDVVEYADEKEEMKPASGTIMDHLITAITRVWTHSDNGLPFMMMADWNDDLSDYAEHRSIMCAQQLYKALNDMIELFEKSGKHKELVSDYREKAKTVKNSVETRGIDTAGNYIRALSPDPKKFPDLGSSKSDGNVFFEPIAWAGFSGIADKERFDKCVAVCDKVLDDKFGIPICKADRTTESGKLPVDHAYWKRNAPGKKENGGEFRHLESWYVSSLCTFGYGEKAYELFTKTIPAVTSSHDPYNYAAERFVYPEYVSSPDSIEHGRAGHTWLTGTAPTRLGCFVEAIFGLQRTYDGLSINPCVTSKWKEFSARRFFRDTFFNITYKNPNGVNKGVKKITVDGKEINGIVIPAEFYDKKEHSVVVEMG